MSDSSPSLYLSYVHPDSDAAFLLEVIRLDSGEPDTSHVMRASPPKGSIPE